MFAVKKHENKKNKKNLSAFSLCGFIPVIFRSWTESSRTSVHLLIKASDSRLDQQLRVELDTEIWFNNQQLQLNREKTETGRISFSCLWLLLKELLTKVLSLLTEGCCFSCYHLTQPFSNFFQSGHLSVLKILRQQRVKYDKKRHCIA